MRFFNTSGPVVAADHYCIPPLSRLDLGDTLQFVRNKRYFVLHAPRQTGKTSALLALRDLLNGGTEGAFRCVYVNVEGAQAAREDRHAAMRAILGSLASRARAVGDPYLDGIWADVLAEYGPDAALGEALTRWAEAVPVPTVLFIDEIDALVGDSLLAVLRQLRAGYDMRPESFPQSVALCGVRDVRDYRIHSATEKAVIAGGSAFNIKAASMRLGDFSAEEVQALLNQHTQETGQEFTPDAVVAITARSQGQPWLVNALADEACFRRKAGRNRTRAIHSEDIADAQEALILRRETHLDQLADKLREHRVRRVIEPLLSGGDQGTFSQQDIEYVRDLGLVAQDPPLRVANPIYAEIVPRELTAAAQEGLVEDRAWYVAEGGSLNTVKLIERFQSFFREHSEHWVARFDYQEAGPQLLLQAFLQRIVNGGGRIEREYGLGRGRTDLLLIWGGGDAQRRFVIECKVLHQGLESTIAKGIEQTASYMDRCGAAIGHLVIFDRDEKRTWEQKLFHRREAIADTTIHIWGM